MAVLRKWNPWKHEYEPYQIPDDWFTPIYSDDMDLEISCAGCGKKIKFGDGYNSLHIHTAMGFSYCICGDCLKEEVKRNREAIEKEERREADAVREREGKDHDRETPGTDKDERTGEHES